MQILFYSLVKKLLSVYQNLHFHVNSGKDMDSADPVLFCKFRNFMLENNRTPMY